MEGRTSNNFPVMSNSAKPLFNSTTTLAADDGRSSSTQLHHPSSTSFNSHFDTSTVASETFVNIPLDIGRKMSSDGNENGGEGNGGSGGSHEVSKCPDGGLRAWSVVAGGFLIYFATFGYLNSFGVYQIYYHDTLLYPRSHSDISWIGSMQLFCLYFGGIIFGPMFDMYGARALFIPGTVIYVLAIMLQSLSTKYYQLILTQGVMFGIGDAMLFYPTISSVSHWFDKRRAFALGVVVAGSSLGGVVWPILIESLMTTIGYKWTVRTSGFMCLAFLAPSIFLVRERIPSARATARRTTKPTTSEAGEVIEMGENKANVKTAVDSVSSNPFSAKLVKEVFRDTRYTWFVGGTFLVFWGMFIPYYYLPEYGKYYKMSNSAANYLVAYVNAGSLVGRLSSGLIADKFGRFNVSFSCAILSAILILVLHRITVPAGIIVYAVLYGITSGGLISLQSACVTQITPDIRQVGLKIGMMMALCSLVGLTGAPIAGAILAEKGHHTMYWSGLINFAGVVMVAGSGAIAFARFKVDRRWNVAK